MYSGLLSGKMTAERIKNMPADDWRQRDSEFQMPRLEQNLRLVSVLTEIGKQHGVEPGAVAIAWTLQNSAVTAAIVGARRPSQVDGILPAAAIQLSTKELEQLRSMVSSKS
jgi:aryl-alcohol dehydrogenase-like predicted oxidoreductase